MLSDQRVRVLPAPAHPPRPAGRGVAPAHRRATRLARLGLFTRVEQAALTVAESVTTVSQQHLADDEYDLLREDLTDDQLALLIYAASMINAFNRVSILSHHPVTYRESFGAPLRRSTNGS